MASSLSFSDGYAGARRADNRGKLRGPLALSLGVVAIVLVPYSTVTLWYRQALYVQAAIILLVVLAMLTAGALRRRSHPNWRELQLPLIGLGCWTAAALAGGVSGVLHGNELVLVAGQLLSLGLLPLGALAGLGLAGGGAWRWFRGGLVGAATFSAILHVGYWVWSLSRGAPFTRLLFPNNVSPTGVALLAFLAALSLVASRDRRQRAVGAFCSAAIVLFVFGAAVRSLWVATVLSLATLCAVMVARAGVPARRLLVIAASPAACILLLCGLAFVWLLPTRFNLLTKNGIWALPKALSPGLDVIPVPEEQGGFAFSWLPSAPPSALLGRTSIGEGGVYRLRVWLRGSGNRAASIALHCDDAWNGYCGSGLVRCAPAGAWRLVESVFLLPAGSNTCHFQLEAGPAGVGSWLARPASLERLGNSSFAPLLALQLREMWERTGGVVSDLRRGGGTRDWGIADRLAESAAILAAYREARPLDKILGHGLGATFRFRTASMDEMGRWRAVDSQNYIHNFFLFSVFKLGLAGTAAVVVALAAWIVWTVRNASAQLPAAEGAFLAAAAVAWVAYTGWSVACPEILDFRMAPLWGLLLAASADAATRGSQDMRC